MTNHCSYPAIHLFRKADGTTTVSIEVDNKWVEVIRDSGGIISHIVEPLGIAEHIRECK